MSVELTPVVGLPIAIEGESSIPLETPIRTDDEGIARRSVRSSDTVTISSLIPGIDFTPISGAAMVLYLSGQQEVAATRLVESEAICRKGSAADEQEVVYRYFNITDSLIAVDHDEFMNAIVRSDGTPIALQAPESYSSGPGSFSIPLEAFRLGEPNADMIGGKWKFLGELQEFSFNSATEANPIPWCEGEGRVPCSPVTEARLQGAGSRAQQELFAFFNYITSVRPAFRSQSDRLPFQRRVAKALRIIRSTIRGLQGRVYECTIPPPGCQRSELPREKLQIAFGEVFSGSPPTLEKRVAKYGAKAKKRYGKYLASNMPGGLYVCDSSGRS